MEFWFLDVELEFGLELENSLLVIGFVERWIVCNYFLFNVFDVWGEWDGLFDDESFLRKLFLLSGLVCVDIDIDFLDFKMCSLYVVDIYMYLCMVEVSIFFMFWIFCDIKFLVEF